MQIIAESGGTKTDWRFIHSNGEVKQQSSSGLNPTYASNEEMLNLLKLELAVDFSEPIEQIHFYGAGCHGNHNLEQMNRVLSSFFPHVNEINVHHDLLAACRASSADKEGIICILGTGSSACLYDGERITKQMVNLGYILGDEGSGAYIGKIFLKDYFEGRLPEALHALFKEENLKLKRDELIDHLYKRNKPNKFLAQFFPFVLKNQADSYCQKLLIQAFDSYINYVVACFPQASHLPLHFVGGVAFHANPILRRVLQKKGLNSGFFMESPIAGLTLYHQKKI